MLMGNDSIGDFLVGFQFRQSGADDIHCLNVADGVGDISRGEFVSIRGRENWFTLSRAPRQVLGASRIPHLVFAAEPLPRLSIGYLKQPKRVVKPLKKGKMRIATSHSLAEPAFVMFPVSASNSPHRRRIQLVFQAKFG